MRLPHLGLLIIILPILLLLSCRSTNQIIRSEEEIAFAKEAVIEMVLRSSSAAGGNLSRTGGWKGSFATFVPHQVSHYFEKEVSIPGLSTLLERYLEEMNRTIFSISPQLFPFIAQEVLPTIEIEDPFSLIENSDNEVTLYFASVATPLIERWITAQLESEAGEAPLATWREMMRLIATYNRSMAYFENRGESDAFDENLGPIESVVVATLRQFFSDMMNQEALIRTMAPSYDNPLLSLYLHQ